MPASLTLSVKAGMPRRQHGETQNLAPALAQGPVRMGLVGRTADDVGADQLQDAASGRWRFDLGVGFQGFVDPTGHVALQA